MASFSQSLVTNTRHFSLDTEERYLVDLLRIHEIIVFGQRLQHLERIELQRDIFVRRHHLKPCATTCHKHHGHDRNGHADALCRPRFASSRASGSESSRRPRSQRQTRQCACGSSFMLFRTRAKIILLSAFGRYVRSSRSSLFESCGGSPKPPSNRRHSHRE